MLYRVTRKKLGASAFRGISVTFRFKIVYLLFAIRK